MLREYTKFLLRGKRLAKTTKKIYYCVVDPEQGRSASEQLGFQENFEEELRPRPEDQSTARVLGVVVRSQAEGEEYGGRGKPVRATRGFIPLHLIAEQAVRALFVR